ncbi:type IV pili methyl-accepting chemotaxis transducer N-terminal domain-containing protein, partial [Arthrospira platensis SPKY1]|nr:type IV pili methyl-accepting chemotaxis transducer N-terminal domain-containing protein [Arthrospira platensis SPKY1]
MGIALIVLLISLIAISFFITRNSNYDVEYGAHASDLRVLSQEIAKNATEAASGKEAAFEQLKKSRNEFEQKLNLITQGNNETGLPASTLPFETNVSQRWET